MSLKIVQQSEVAARLVLPESVQISLEGLAGDVRKGLLALSVSAGLAVIDAIMQEEIAEACGPKGKHDPERVAVRHTAEQIVAQDSWPEGRGDEAADAVG